MSGAAAVEESLECGSSLAEREHQFHSYTAGKPSHASLLPVNSSTADSPATTDSKGGRCEIGIPNTIQSVAGLRSWIGRDVLTSESFVSPFEHKQQPERLGGSEDNRDTSKNTNSSKFYRVPLVYCDQTASNRPLRSIESYLERVCLPLYGNTHTNTSVTGSQTTAFVAEARQLVAETCNAKITGKASLDVVLFAGQGATSAVELLIDCLGLEHACQSSSDKSQRPIVFVGPWEHHSNLIPWRESGCEIVMVPECPETHQPDLDRLEALLQTPRYHKRLRMGAFSAASNVTGKVANVNAIAACLHRNGALAFFDYATAAPYVKMDMNPSPDPPLYESTAMVAKDALFYSPHKMLGGVGSPGVLVVKKELVSQRNAPRRSGGGTVFYVSHESHRFLGNRIERYEGGTPNVPGILRAGLACLAKRQTEEMYDRARCEELKVKLTQEQKKERGTESSVVLAQPSTLEECEYRTYETVATFLAEHAPNLVLLGRHEHRKSDGLSDQSPAPKKLPLFSFLIRWGKRFLHYNYVCAVLNDVFGIQSRGGCQCSGPYSQYLLGLTVRDHQGNHVSNGNNRDLEQALVEFKERAELLRPGYTRLSLPFKGLVDEEVEYVKKALVWVSEHAWELICQYRCNHRTGEWRHMSRQGRPLGRAERRWLGLYSIQSSASVPGSFATPSPASTVSARLERAWSNATAILAAAREDRSSITATLKLAEAENVLGVDDKLEKLRWYVYPQECALILSQGIFHTPPLEEIVGALSPLELELRTDAAKSPAIGAGTSRASHGRTNSLVDSQHASESLGTFIPEAGPKKAPRDSSIWGLGRAEIHPETAASPNCNGTSGTNESIAATRKHLHARPPQKMMRLCIQAVYQWDMIQDGDRLLLGLSGGKDSLSLLHVLLEIRRRLPVKFELEVCTVDPMTPSFDPSPLIPYVESLGLKYHYLQDGIVARAESSGKGGQEVSSLCSFCARMKRGKLYTCARENKCNKLVLAQHLDDCAESFMMSVMHNGFLRTMQANYMINAGDLSVIRPFVYCRERLMTDFAKTANLPVINENCPACFEEPKERARIKKLLSREESLYPNFFENIRRSLIPLMHADSTAILRSYLDETLAQSKSIDKRKRKREYPELHVSSSDDSPNGLSSSLSRSLKEASDEDLVRELALRRAGRYRLAGASKFTAGDEISGPACSSSAGCTNVD